MRKVNKNNIFYIVANIFYIFATISCISLYSNIMEIGFFGLLFLVSYIVYSGFTFIFILLKKDRDIVFNIVKLIIYCYLIFLYFRCSALGSDTYYAVSELYLKISFLVCSVTLMVTIFNGIWSRDSE